MPRQRMVRPDFFASASLAECSVAARLAFIGLWVMGDDNGNVKLSVKKLNRQIFPLDDLPDAVFAGYLGQLEAQGCIRVYEADGERFVNVPNFKLYQTVKNPSKSSNPEPPEGTPKKTKHFREVLGKSYPSAGTTPVLPQRYPSPTPLVTPNKESSKEGETTPKVVVSPDSFRVDARSAGSAGEGPAGVAEGPDAVCRWVAKAREALL